MGNSLNTQSLASEPERPNTTFLSFFPGVILINFSAKAVDVSFGKDVVETCVARFTCSVTASTILGWQYPVLATAHPARKSRYSSHRRPKVSLPRLDLLP